MPRALLLALMVAVAALAAREAARAHAQAPGAIAGSLPRAGGFGLVVWSGGSVGELATAAGAQGCTLSAVWTARAGALTGHILGAPAFVNAAFEALFPGGALPAQSALLLVCRAAGTPAAPPPAAQTFEQQLSRAIAAAINRERTSRGFAALGDAPALYTSAEQYIVRVRDAQQLSHTLDGEPWDRAQRAGYTSSWVGEVLAAHSVSAALSADAEAARFVQQWMDSAPHRAIILDGSYTQIGVGCATGRLGNLSALYCVGMTGRP
jgi:uncharacterized protein YkwD